MTLSQQQQIFTKNIGLLIEFAQSVGIGLTFGQAWRSRSQQILYYFGFKVKIVGETLRLKKSRKLSKTLNSLHLDRLAVDFNHFIKGNVLTYDKEELQVLGDFWESLHPLNKWGGNFKNFEDTPHYEMKRM